MMFLKTASFPNGVESKHIYTDIPVRKSCNKMFSYIFTSSALLIVLLYTTLKQSSIFKGAVYLEQCYNPYCIEQSVQF